MVKGIGGALFGLAIISASARTLLRLRNKSRLGLDDALLLFACLCLVASTALFYTLAPGVYLFEQVIADPNHVQLPPDVNDLVIDNLKMVDAYSAISWLVIYAVKFCFLSFMRSLIDRIRSLIIYWRAIVGITVVFFGISVSETFIACPQFTILAGELHPSPRIYNHDKNER